MPNIGAVDFLFLKGKRKLPGEMLTQLRRRAGVDGEAWRKEGTHGKMSTYTGFKPLLTANIAAFEKSVNDLRATVQTMVDDYGVTFNNVVVKDTELTAKEPISVSAGGSLPPADFMLTFSITLQLTEKP